MTKREGKRRAMVRPLVAFLRTEASSGVLLVIATVIALLWANLGGGSYERFWHSELSGGIGPSDLRHWINDGLMVLFFFVVGLEIKREVVSGELRDRRAIALPAAAALGGMIVPALIYLALNPSGPGTRGWGIPMATDIAFALGVLAVVGRRLPQGLKVFLLALAIIDDLGAIVVIAVFYGEAIAFEFLTVALMLLVAMVVLRRLGVRAPVVHVVLAVGVWLAVFASGVHATIAGVAVAFVTPARAGGARRTAPLVRAEELLHPVTSFVVVPLFALANAGVGLRGADLGSGGASRVALGVALGLLVGKTVGITAGAALATRLRVARLPDGVSWEQVAGVAAVGGIGFTVSLFVSGLAFTDARLLDAAKIGVFGGSILSGVAGAALLARARRR